jgi:hypothetical protein
VKKSRSDARNPRLIDFTGILFWGAGGKGDARDDAGLMYEGNVCVDVFARDVTQTIAAC